MAREHAVLLQSAALREDSRCLSRRIALWRRLPIQAVWALRDACSDVVHAGVGDDWDAHSTDVDSCQWSRRDDRMDSGRRLFWDPSRPASDAGRVVLLQRPPWSGSEALRACHAVYGGHSALACRLDGGFLSLGWQRCRETWILTLLWFGIGLGLVLMAGRGYGHYFMSLTPALAVAAGLFFWSVESLRRK
jgi:hypothetical protein